jgi:hypothetical protein
MQIDDTFRRRAELVVERHVLAAERRRVRRGHPGSG